jgi:hypothetical protein
MATASGLIKKTITVPAAVARRKREWKHFGSVTPENCFSATSLGEEVFMEFAFRNGKGSSKQLLLAEQSRAISHAYRCGFSFNTVKQIEESETPMDTFREFVHQQMKGIVMRVKSTLAEGEPVKLQSKGPVGLKARMRMCKTKTEEAVSGAEGSMGLRARLTTKNDSRGEEHERSLFVSNVPCEFTERDIHEELGELMGEEVSVERINIVRKPNNQGVKESIGKAFIVCNTIEDAKEMMDLLNNRVRWGQCIIDVQPAESRK